MLLSQLFGKTQKETPREADTISHRLLLRAGMIEQVASGVYSYLPLAQRIIRSIEAIVRDEMNKAGGQEVTLPVLQPIELWQKSGRDRAFGESLFTLTDRKGQSLVLGPTHEEVFTEMVKRHVQSYRDLPLMLYQIQSKFRDEPRPRGGLLRVREFTMKDLYSFDQDEEGLDQSYQKMARAYQNIYRRSGLNAVMVEADSGAIGGKESHEFILPAESGEDEIVSCTLCGYAANMEKAAAVKSRLEEEEEKPLGEVFTPGKKTIEEVTGFLNLEKEKTLKSVFYNADERLVLAIIRGDYEINETKLKNALKVSRLTLASHEDILRAGVVPGSASPIGLKEILVIADDSVLSGRNFVAGANRPDHHLLNVNCPRDFEADLVLDIARVREGDPCPRCGGNLKISRGIEVGHIFKLGTFISERLGAYFTDASGSQHPIIMGSYGIGIGRLMAAAVEQNHDENGIIWPASIAPYQVYLCPIFAGNTGVSDAAENLYHALEEGGISTLVDDRSESPGVKFNDADLLGLPLRITISPRTIENRCAELKWRDEKSSSLLPLDGLAEKVKSFLQARSTAKSGT